MRNFLSQLTKAEQARLDTLGAISMGQHSAASLSHSGSEDARDL